MKSKNKLYSIALASAILIFVFSILISSVVSAAQVTRVGNGSNPAIYDSKVVWTDSGVIHIYDLTRKQTLQLALLQHLVQLFTATS